MGQNGYFRYKEMMGKGKVTHLHTHSKRLLIVHVDLLILLSHGLQKPTVHVGPILSITPHISILRPLGLRQLFSLLGGWKQCGGTWRNIRTTKTTLRSCRNLQRRARIRSISRKFSVFHLFIKSFRSPLL